MTERRAGSLRLKLLAAFVLLSTPPLVILAGAVIILVDRAFDAAVEQRLTQGIGAAKGRIDDLARLASGDVDNIAETLAAEPSAESGTAWLTQQRLEVLEVLDSDNRVLWSRHWPAGFGLLDRDRTFAGVDHVRLEKAAQDYGAADRLTLTATRPSSWAGQRGVQVRGGYFLDEAFWDEMHGLMGLEVGLWDKTRKQFVTRADSGLRAWAPLAPKGSGPLLPKGASYRWDSRPLGTDLAVYVAAPLGEWDTLSFQVRSLSIGVAAASLGLAIAAALALARRIARPAGALADAARRVAAGDLEAQAPVMGDDELASLAQAFNRMTSDLRTAQERLVQAERVAAWREIARRLAHELKNPIFPIALSMETVQRAFAGVPLPAPSGTDLGRLLRDSTQTTLDELRRLQRVVDEFSAFARMPQPQMRPTDLGALVREVAALYQARAAGIQVEIHTEPDLPAVSADPDLLVRALSNLVANALESMTDGGTLQLRTLQRDGSAVIEVEDNGPGITEEQKARLFVPYFTTKPGGTGLGLAIVQGIASDHGGRVEVRPAAARGTIFSLLLPVPVPPDGVRDSKA
jgi:two-component system, NtrC family, nitrogen regulation sensor histidine kinase NtrY